MSISTHVLDQTRGMPAAGVQVRLERRDGDAWHAVAQAATDGDGRVSGMFAVSEAGEYRLCFATGAYFAAAGVDSFHPEVTITFAVRDVRQHYHVPLLLGPWGYTTYRGS